ncbi:MAG: methionyl-tRNA formyltransferase [Solirubrobacteraceae bacterium]
MSIVFLGTSEFAANILERLAGSARHRPALVITRPDRPSGRGRRLTPPPVAERARSLGIPLEQPASVNAADARVMIAAAGPEGERRTLVVCAFGALIKEPLLSEHEILNVHPSLLPRWRGAAPIERAIMAGDERTGVSIMRLTAGLDSGPVCLEGALPISAQDTYGSLSERLQELGGELLLRALEESPAFREQPEQGVTYAEKLAPEDRLLDSRRPAAELDRRVRALHPHVGARLALPDGSFLGVRRAALAEPPPAHAGARSPGAAGPARPEAQGLAGVGGRLMLICDPGTLELLEVQPPGGRLMDGGSYLRGHPALGRL